VREPKDQDRSKLKAVKGAEIIVPQNVDTNRQVLPMSPLPESKPLKPASDVFPLLGIDSVYEGGWKVRAIRVDSPADRAGVKAGDILEAIDDNQLGKDAMFKSGFNGKVIKVKRDGKSVELTLANK
jgi:S1-C subfamily serine protease